MTTQLTARQEQVMEALARLGCAKLVARELDMQLRTIEAHMRRIRARLGVRFTLLAVLQWDRARRAA